MSSIPSSLTSSFHSLLITDIESCSHSAVTTADAHAVALSSCQPHLTGVQCKNLFVKDKRSKALFLIVIPIESKIILKTIASQLSLSELRFDQSTSLADLLKVEAGSVTPLAVINDTEHKVTVVLDKQFDASSSTRLLLHPLVNNATISMKASDLNKFLTSNQTPLKFIDSMSEEAASAPSASSSSSSAGESKSKPAKSSGDKPAKQAKSKFSAAVVATNSTSGKSKNQDGIDKDKMRQFADWYTQVVVRSEMIEYYDISGCYILRPHSYEIWESIQEFLNSNIKKLGVKNSYFPIFVSKAALESEEDHIEGFAAEVAWVTRSGKSELAEPIAVRPTSETIMYPQFAKWIRSHRDLPLKLNQWNNVVRWEFKCPTPFIRSREFLWQEGHTAFETKEEAAIEVEQILDLYARVYEELLAVPVTKGRKTDVEKFAGGLYTTTVEAFIPATGRGIQGATSHCLGQNFARIFKINYESRTGATEMVWQNSWGLTTRTIGVAVMVHGDNAGLVLPPRVAPIQVVIIPILFSDTTIDIKSQANKLNDELLAAGIRSRVDDRNQTPGWKYSHWELKGVCVRIELGPKDMEAQQCVSRRRDQRDDKSKSQTIKWTQLTQTIKSQLEQMQQDMFDKAKREMLSRRSKASTWSEFIAALDKRNTVLVPFCSTGECEKSVKKRSGEMQDDDANEAVSDEQQQQETGEKLTGAAKSLCIPFEQDALPKDEKCFACDKAAINYTLFGRSY